MPCTSCGTEFGIFKKEHGCKNCGFAFCGSCLGKKAVVPKLGTQKHSVCGRCYESLNSKQGPQERSPAKFSPPAALQRRLESLQDKQKVKSSGSGNSKAQDSDEVIASRLEKLRRDKIGSVPSETELEERLLKLKGVGPQQPPSLTPSNRTNQPKVFYTPPQHKTASEQAASLYKQMQDEVVLDSKLPNPDQEIANRLSRLRGDDEPWNDLNNPGRTAATTASNTAAATDINADTACGNTLPNNIGGSTEQNNINEVDLLMKIAAAEARLDAEKALRGLEADRELKRKLDEIKANQNRSSRSMQENEDSEEEEEDKLTDKLIAKLLEEDALDKSCSDIGMKREKKELNTPDSDENSDNEELPWCAICNDDALLRCHGCDGELYCQRCFRECHDSGEIKQHKTSPFKGKKTRS